MAQTDSIINSALFGEISVPKEKIINFQNGIPGIPEIRFFSFLDITEYSPLVWMVSINGQLHLPVIPIGFLPDAEIDDISLSVYRPQITSLLANQPNAVAYTILKLSGNVKKINLKAPLLVDSVLQTGEQVILDRFVLHES